MPFAVSAPVLFTFPPNFCFAGIKPEQRLPDLAPEWISLTETCSRPGTSTAVTSSFTRTPVYILHAVTNALQGHQVLLNLHLLLHEISVWASQGIHWFMSNTGTFCSKLSFILSNNNSAAVAGQILGWCEPAKGFGPSSTVVLKTRKKKKTKKIWKQETERLALF